MIHAIAMLLLLAFATHAQAQTRLYINNLPESFNPAPRGSWDDTSPNLGGLHFSCRTTKGGSVSSTSNTEASTLDGHRVLVLTCVSEALATDQMLGGPGTSVSWVLGTAEANTIQDNYWRAHIWVSNGSTDALRGTLLNEYAESAATAPGNEWPAAHAKGWANYGSSVPLSGAAIDAHAGDRVIIEIGATLYHNGGAGYASTLWLGGTGAQDLSVGGDETTAQGWFQLSQTIAFVSPPIVNTSTPTSTSIPTSTSTPTSTRTPTSTSTPANTPTVTQTPPNTPTPSVTPDNPQPQTFTVNSLLDLHDGMADGVCSADAGGAGPCTLRAAVESGNQHAGPVTVNVPDGTYLIDLGEMPATGDLLIQGTGSGPQSVVIKLVGRITPRAFAVAPGASLTLKNLTVLDYRNSIDAAVDGACLYNIGTLTLDNVVLDHCDNSRSPATPPLGKGGSLHNAGTLFSRNGTRFDTGISNWGACLFNAKFATANLTDTEFLNCHTLGEDAEDVLPDGETSGGGAGMFNAGTVLADRVSFIYCRARLGLGGGAILNGDELGDAGLGAGGTITLTNATFARNRCRRCEGGAFTSYGGTINAKLTTMSATQSAFVSAIILRDGAVLNADRMIIEGHNISNPSSGFEVCFTASGGQVNVIGPAPSMDDSLDTTPPRITCPGFTPANVCLQSDGDYGGLVDTVKLNTSSTCTSAAIDAGGATCGEAVDARGFSRPAGAGCDLGSYEVQP